MKFKILLCCVLMSVVCVGCNINNDSPEEKTEHKAETEIKGARFTTKKASGVGYIVIDKETGVQYLYVKNGYGGGLTVLVDAEGKPLLYKVVE